MRTRIPERNQTLPLSHHTPLWGALLVILMMLAILAPAHGQPTCPALTTFSTEGNTLYPDVLDAGFQEGDYDKNIMIEKWEIALAEYALCTETAPYYNEFRTLFQANLDTLRAEAHYATTLQPYENFLACVLSMSQNKIDVFGEALALTGAYTPFAIAKTDDEPFSWIGDYDSDGVPNISEYFQAKSEEGAGRLVYVEYATDPAQTGNGDFNPYTLPDFCTDFNSIANSGILKLLLDENMQPLLEMLQCPVADINGGIDLDSELPIPNGMLDAFGELGMVYYVLAHPELDLSAGNLPGQVAPGVKYSDVLLAYNFNSDLIYNYVGEDAIGLLRGLGLSALSDGLLELLSAMVLLGDQTTKGAMLYLFGLVAEYAVEKNPDPESFRFLEATMAWNGDADGDGYCNILEYNAFFDEEDNTNFMNAVFDPEIVPPGTNICPSIEINLDDLYHYNPTNGHVYRLTDYATTWDGCQTFAYRHQIGDLLLPGELVTIRDADENQWLLDDGLVADDRWIGLSDIEEEGVFKWASGEPLTFENWNSGEPNDSGGDEEWAEIKEGTGRWNDLPYRGQMAIIEFVGPCEGRYPDFNEDGNADAFTDNDLDGTPDGFPVNCDDTAVFSVTTATLDNGAAATITLSPANAEGLSAGQFYNGDKVDISITYDSGQDTFKAWNFGGEGNVSTETHTIVVLSDMDIYAVFEQSTAEGEGEGTPPVIYTLTTSVSGNTAPATLNASPASSEGLEPGQYYEGSLVYLTLDYDDTVDYFLTWNFNGEDRDNNEHPRYLNMNKDWAAMAVFVPVGEGEGEGEGFVTPAYHSGDYIGPDNLIDLSELLRFIQFFNSDGYHCAAEGDVSDEGYMPGPGDQSCAKHVGDYADPAWEIDLSELLRFIQFFNFSKNEGQGYHACDDPASDEGYCPGPPPTS